jgi:mannose-6-phosphate isomerase-like protein (cupin superfamily)
MDSGGAYFQKFELLSSIMHCQQAALHAYKNKHKLLYSQKVCEYFNWKTESKKILEPNKGKHIAIVGDINTILAFKEDTGGTYSFIEAKVFPGGGPIPHIQTREHEWFYVVEGQIIFNVDEQRIEAKPGTFVNIPPNVLHSFKNETNETAKLIIVLSPPGMEQLFVDIGLEVSDINKQPPPFTDEQKQKLPSLAAKYGMEIKLD